MMIIMINKLPRVLVTVPSLAISTMEFAFYGLLYD